MIWGAVQFVLHSLTAQLSNIRDRRKIISGFPFWLGDYKQQCMRVTKKCQRLLQSMCLHPCLFDLPPSLDIRTHLFPSHPQRFREKEKQGNSQLPTTRSKPRSAHYTTIIILPQWGSIGKHVCGHVLTDGERIWWEYSMVYLCLFVFIKNKYPPVFSKASINVFLVTL